MPSCRYVCCVKHIKQVIRTSVSCILSSAVDKDSLLRVAFQTAALWCCKYPAEQWSLTQEGGNMQSNGDYLQERDTNKGCQTETAYNSKLLQTSTKAYTKPKPVTAIVDILNIHCYCKWKSGKKRSPGPLQSGNRNSSMHMDCGLGTIGFTTGWEITGPELCSWLALRWIWACPHCTMEISNLHSCSAEMKAANCVPTLQQISQKGHWHFQPFWALWFSS